MIDEKEHLSNEFSISLVGYAAYDASTFLEVNPTLVMSLSLVKIHIRSVAVNFIEPKLVWVILCPQNIKSDATGFLARSFGICLDHSHELVHAIWLDFRFDDDRERFGHERSTGRERSNRIGEGRLGSCAECVRRSKEHKGTNRGKGLHCNQRRKGIVVVDLFQKTNLLQRTEHGVSP
jgi:hypothetical protein